MSAVASPRRHNDENSIPQPHRDAFIHHQHHQHHQHHHAEPRLRQPLAPFDHLPNVYPHRFPATPAHASRPMLGSAPGADATPVRPIATKVDPDARELPLPKGMTFGTTLPPASSLLPPLPTPPHSRAPPQHMHPSPGYHVHHHMHPMGQTPRHMGYAQHQPPTPSARTLPLSYSSPSTMSHMPSTPDVHASPYPAGPIDLHELLPPTRFPGPLPQAFLNQGDMPGGDAAAAEQVEDATTPNSNPRRALVSCNPWDYRPEDHGKNKPRRRFSPGELDMLEILWSISHNPHKWQRQKLARWFGCTTRHLTVWFQNRRQDLKKAETLVQMAESNPDTASRALAAVNRANRGDQVKFSMEQSQVIMDIVSDRLLPEMWWSQQPSGSSPTPQKNTPSPPMHGGVLPGSRMQFAPAPIAPKPLHNSMHSGHMFALKPVRRGYSLDDVCGDREQSMTHRPSPRPRNRFEGLEQLHKNDPRYREALINMLPSELSSDAIEPPEDEEDSIADEDSPTRKRARRNSEIRAPRPTLPPIGLGRPLLAGHRPRSSFGRASSSDVLACSSRARFLANSGLGSIATTRAVTDPVPSRSASAGPTLPPVPEHARKASETESKKRKLSRQGSWSHLPSLKHRDSFDRARGEAPIEEQSSPSVPGQTRSPTPTDADSVSPKTAKDDDSVSSKSEPSKSEPASKPRLPVPEGRSIYSFSTVLEPQTRRGALEMDENVMTGAHALMELLRGREV